MFTKNSLIFVVEDDIPCGKLVQYYLLKNGFKKVILFEDEKACLANMSLEPKVLITDYRLKNLNGLRLVQKAKKLYPGFHCILLSGMSYREIFTDRSSHPEVDKFIMKGLNSLQEVYNTLCTWLHEQYIEQYY